jgi:hypothetical protein
MIHYDDLLYKQIAKIFFSYEHFIESLCVEHTHRSSLIIHLQREMEEMIDLDSTLLTPFEKSSEPERYN